MHDLNRDENLKKIVTSIESFGLEVSQKLNSTDRKYYFTLRENEEIIAEFRLDRNMTYADTSERFITNIVNIMNNIISAYEKFTVSPQENGLPIINSSNLSYYISEQEEQVIGFKTT